MASEVEKKPSFSPWRRWGIGFNVFLIVFVVFSVVVMVNYLSRDYFMRFQANTRARIRLSPRTVKVLETLTNHVKVVVYFDKENSLYNSVAALLNEYRLQNPRISVDTVDYLRDPGGAQKVKLNYKLANASDKNLIIFDCEGKKSKIVDGAALADYTLVQEADDPTPTKRAVAFKGELLFTGALLWITNPRSLRAYLLQGHGEPAFSNPDARQGYSKFAGVLQQDYIRVDALTLLGTNTVPADCNLLVIAGPSSSIQPGELEKIQQYLDQGGRLFLLLSAEGVGKDAGLQKILAGLDVGVGDYVVQDPEHSDQGDDVIVSAFVKHEIVNPLIGNGLFLIRPRPVGRMSARTPALDAPRIVELAFSGDAALITNRPPQRYPLIAAVEKGALKGMVTERGTMRVVVAGDSNFLMNSEIDKLANREFASYAINWLLNRNQLLETGLGPQPIKEYRLIMTRAQTQAVQWILLAGMPGIALALGVLVWLRRRK